MFSIRGGSEECTKLLLENGANPTIEPSEGFIFEAAKKIKSPNIRNLLRKYFLYNNLPIPPYMGEFETEIFFNPLLDPNHVVEQPLIKSSNLSQTANFTSNSSNQNSAEIRLHATTSFTPILPDKKKSKKGFFYFILFYFIFSILIITFSLLFIIYYYCCIIIIVIIIGIIISKDYLHIFHILI